MAEVYTCPQNYEKVGSPNPMSKKTFREKETTTADKSTAAVVNPRKGGKKGR